MQSKNQNKSSLFSFFQTILSPFRNPHLIILTLGSLFVLRKNLPELMAIDLPSSCENFKVIHGNPYTAKTLIFSENHRFAEQTKACADDLTKDWREHTVLLELKPSGQLLECKAFQVSEKSGRECRGWDDEQTAKEGFIRNQKHYYAHYFQIIKAACISEGGFFPDKEISTSLKKSLANTRADKEKRRKELKNPKYYSSIDPMPIEYSLKEIDYFYAVIREKVLTDILDQKKSGKSFDFIFKNPKFTETYKIFVDRVIPDSDVDFEELQRRNRKLFDTLKEYDAQKNKNVTLIAGRYHLFGFFDIKTNTLIGEIAQEIQKEFPESALLAFES